MGLAFQINRKPDASAEAGACFVPDGFVSACGFAPYGAWRAAAVHQRAQSSRDIAASSDAARLWTCVQAEVQSPKTERSGRRALRRVGSDSKPHSCPARYGTHVEHLGCY